MKASKINWEKNGQADRLYKILDKLSYLGLFCHFKEEKNGSKFSQIEVVSLTAFSQFFFTLGFQKEEEKNFLELAGV